MPFARFWNKVEQSWAKMGNDKIWKSSEVEL